MPSVSALKERAISSITSLIGTYEPVHRFIPGVLGDAVGTVEVPSRDGYVYVRLLGEAERTVRARNMGVPVVADTDVWVELVGSRGDRERYRVAVVDNAGRSYVGSLDIDDDTIRVRQSKTPATAGAAGSAGDICWDANYLYICIATDTWRRVAHASW